MSRIGGVPAERAGAMTRFSYRYAKRRLGKVPTPLTIVAHSPWIFRGYGAFEFSLERASSVDHKLKALASIKAATLIGCPF